MKTSRPYWPRLWKAASKAREPRRIEDDVGAGVVGEGEDFPVEVEVGADDDVVRAGLDEGGFFRRRGRDGEDARALGFEDADAVDADASPRAGHHGGLPRPGLGEVADGAEDDADGTGGDGGLLQGDGIGDARQARRGDGDELRVAPVDAVADTVAPQTAVLAPREAAGALAAAVRQNRGDAVAGGEVADLVAGLHDDAGDLVAEDEALLDAAAQLPAHHGDVVMAHAGGGDLDQRFARAGARRLDLL